MSKEKSLRFLLFLRSTTKKQPPWDAETDCMSVQLRPPGSSFFLLRDIYPGKIMLAHISLALSVGRSSTGSSFLLQSSRCFLFSRANDASDREEKSATGSSTHVTIRRALRELRFLMLLLSKMYTIDHFHKYTESVTKLC